MFRISHRRTPTTTLAVLAVTIASVAFVSPGATAIEGASGARESGADRGSDPGDRVLRTVVRIARDFEVGPHSLAVNQIVRCPHGTKLTGGGTSLIGQPAVPRNAPIVYTNGPVGRIIPGEQQAWGSEVANRSGETFHYRQFALCATTRSSP